MRFVSLAALLVLTVPAVAQETPSADKPAEKSADTKKICRSSVPTGSMMAKRECHTKAEWQAITERSRTEREKWERDSRSHIGS